MAKKVRYTLVKKQDGQYCTHNADTGNDIHCFKTRNQALRQLKALYASQGDPVGKDKAMSERIDCTEGECDRSFLSFGSLEDHLVTVHDAADARTPAGQQLADMRGGGYVEGGAKALADMRGGGYVTYDAMNKRWEAAEMIALVDCPKCDRKFIGDEAMTEHAEYVHTFEDIRGMVGEKVRENYAKPSTITSGSIYAWVQDLTDSVVYFQVEDATDCETYQATYSISGNNVTLGSPTPVVRRTVYEPAPNDGQAVEAES